MRRLIISLLAFHVITCASVTWAYEIKTHTELSERAVDTSALTTDLTESSTLGLKAPRDNSQKFPNYKGEEKTVLELVQDGSAFEDDGVRSRGHFFNPLNGQALFNLPGFVPSPDWALEDKDDISGQDDSFKDTRQFFLEALTLPSETDRKVKWGRTFQGLGQVIHHLQDMAQPEHSRVDPHLKYTPDGFLVAGPGEDPSRYEKYSRAKSDICTPLSLCAPYGPVQFATPRQFWLTNNGIGAGIAEFTNNNFVSNDTNFVNLSPPDSAVPLFTTKDGYPLPNSAGATVEVREFSELGLPPIDSYPSAPLAGKLYFIGTPIHDQYTHESGFNPLTSTYSIYAGDLKSYGLTYDCNPNNDPQYDPTKVCRSSALFTLNTFNFDAAHQFLINRAIGYSAGLINYFFRGEIDLVPDTNAANPGGYILQNLGDEEISGTFTLYYDDVNNTRYTWRVWTTTGPLPAKTGQFSVPAFASPGAGDPAPKYPGQYILVFTGQMGQETGAVAANIVSAVASGMILTAGGDASGFARPGDGGAVTIETGVSLTPTSPATMPLIVPAGDSLTLGGGLQHYSEIAILGTLQLTADTTLRADGPVGIAGTVEGHTARDGIHLTIESGDVIALSGTITVGGRSGPEMGSGDQPGGNGGSVTLRTASADVFSVPTIITRGGDAALTDTRVPAKSFSGGTGGPITITTNSAPDQLALRFVGTELPMDKVDLLPSQQGAHTLPTTTTFRRGLLTTGGYGGQFKGPDGELGVTVAGTAGGAGGHIAITCSQPSTLHFDKTDLFTGGNIDVVLRYTRQVVFANGQTPRLVTLVQRTGAMGGQGSSGQTHTHGGNGGGGGPAGALTITTCELATPPASFTTPPRVAPLLLGGNPVTGFVTTPRPRLIDAFDASGNRFYTIQAFGGAGGMPGGSGLSLARCSKTGAQCYTDGVACPLAPDFTTQICLPVTGGTGRPGDFGTRGTDGPVSCGPLLIPSALVGTGLVCQ